MKKSFFTLLIALLISVKSVAVNGSDIMMNEIYSRGTTANPDWIEIYNSSSTAIDISGYKIYDIGGQSGSKPKKSFPAGTVIQSKGFFVIVTDDATSSGFGLSSSGEEAWLENASGSVIDSVTFPALTDTQSYGRIPDGSAWQILNTITRGTSNGSYINVSDIMMNEIYSRGTTGNPDWIEIYNSSDSTIDISGYRIYDINGQNGNKPKKEFPGGTVIPSKGFFVIITDDAISSGFGLSGSGEEVWLENASGSVIDSVTFPALTATQSYGRIPDGGVWQILNTVTRGISNSTFISHSDIVMNEIFSGGTTANPDWIEIYNSSSTAIDISGYKIYDIGGQSGSKPKKEFPAGTVIQPKGFFVIVTDDTASSGFGLSGSGEEAWLENASKSVIDSVTFPGLTATQSYGRIPDGGVWQILNTITRGTSNSSFISGSYIVMNEIYSRGTPEDPDWIEIYNSSSTAIDISGYKIYDIGGESGNKPKKEFPAGTIIPSKGFFIIVTDDATSSGFGLSNSGEEVWLENASQSVIDTVTFPALTATQSYGRIPDGGVWQILNTITPGISNASPTDIQDRSLEIKEFRLSQNYPNPFNLTTTISFSLPSKSFVSLKVFDAWGREVSILLAEELPAGMYARQWNAASFQSGIYFYRLQAGPFTETKRLLLLK